MSEEAKFKYTVNGDAVLTANFVQVETYELTLNVEGEPTTTWCFSTRCPPTLTAR